MRRRMVPGRIAGAVLAAAVAMAMLGFGATEAVAGRRVALVVGNGAYRFAPVLANPPNDEADIAAAFRSLGFEVVERHDADRVAMADAVREFAAELPGSDTAVFYYSGHGLQVDGENYLVPVDAKIASIADVRFGTIDLADDPVQFAFESDPTPFLS